MLVKELEEYLGNNVVGVGNVLDTRVAHKDEQVGDQISVFPQLGVRCYTQIQELQNIRTFMLMYLITLA